MGCGRPQGTTKRVDCRIRCRIVAHHAMSLAEIRAAVGTIVTQQTVTSLLQGQLRLCACSVYSPEYKSLQFVIRVVSSQSS
ncbi:hypothetical protein TNCV_4375861 [Trichonephila clavipes]|uniref:Uncharacterized protein n=1 Tax=Trichonephila clavipes TaxID=2585209 RepID=A0A8X6W239_TRICX|nr:hypothetical protein TNCV_4375861 [Trichonephila clavipes]